MEEGVIMKYARTDRKAKKPTRKNPTDAGLDLYALGLCVIKVGQMKVVGTGIALELPEGTMGLIKPKSRDDILVGAGVVDQDYRGEVKIKVYNAGLRTLYIQPGDAVAQLVVVPILTSDLELAPYDSLQKTERGKSGGINEAK